jgi:hypothetical protein
LGAQHLGVVRQLMYNALSPRERKYYYEPSKPAFEIHVVKIQKDKSFSALPSHLRAPELRQEKQNEA